jgi:3-oxoacyl-[acyl-carrier protein] reductase
MDLYLKNKVVVITGGSRGIGRAIAEHFAEEGAHVALCARNEEQVRETVKALEKKGVKAYGQAADIADAAAVKRFIEGAAAALGGIDILVANASCLTHGDAEENWRAAIDTDVMGTKHAYDAAEPYLLAAAEAKGDACVLITSSMAATLTEGPDAYGAMKAALIHYGKGLARKGAPKKLRCNVISPGTILFEGGSWSYVRDNVPDLYKQMIALNPLGRMGKPEEIAAAAVFLASPRSAFTTGINMVIDGTMAHRVNF